MRLFACLIAAPLLVAAPVAAAEDKGAASPRELLGEAGEKIFRALDLMMKAIPQYAAPEVNERGDIIIRRIRPDEPAPEIIKPEPIPTGRDKPTAT